MDIRPVDPEHLPDAARVIRLAFETVADAFGLTPANCPSHPAFLTEERLRAQVRDGLRLFGCYTGNVLAGVVGIGWIAPREFGIEKLAVLPSYRHRRLGSKLMVHAQTQILRDGGEKALIGIIAENAVLRRWCEQKGFVATAVRRDADLPFAVCVLEKPLRRPAVDDTCWEPVSVDEAARVFAGVGVPWWISGGWALDLHLGEQTRPHEDTDILILRRDQLVVQRHLREWQLFKTHQPGLAPWPADEFLHPPVNSIWVRREEGAPWAFEIMLMDTEGDDWVYRRFPAIRGPIAGLGLWTEGGVPYLCPEVQLLYKGRHEYRPKDLQDLQAVLPHLPADKRQWLLDCLRRQYPDGHGWMSYLQG